jgi:hypothetical protein
MPIQKECCSLELAKQLKELGVEQDSLFWWMEYNDGVNEIHYEPNASDYRKSVCCSAFTSSELGEILPAKYKEKLIVVYKGDDELYYCETAPTCEQAFWDNTMANAMAKMIIYLKQNNLILYV